MYCSVDNAAKSFGVKIQFHMVVVHCTVVSIEWVWFVKLGTETCP
jgi:hypothetical protein